jgi:dTDP-4-dehydrorhamnose reductase
MAAAHPRTLIVRPSKVIESLGILGTWRAQLQQGQSISAFSDQYLAPIPRRLLAQQIGALLLGGHAGCYNFSAADRMSYDAIAHALCDHLAADPAQVIATRARDQNPFFFQQDVLDCSAAAKATGYAPPLARDIIFDYIRKLP